MLEISIIFIGPRVICKIKTKKSSIIISVVAEENAPIRLGQLKLNVSLLFSDELNNATNITKMARNIIELYMYRLNIVHERILYTQYENEKKKICEKTE